MGGSTVLPLAERAPAWAPAPVSGDEWSAAARALRDALLELPEELFQNVLMCL